jgi:hypothetical protein
VFTPRGRRLVSCPVFGETGVPPDDPCTTPMSRLESMPNRVVEVAPAKFSVFAEATT